MVNLFTGIPRKFDQGSYNSVLQPNDLAPTTKQVIGTYIDEAFLGDLTYQQLKDQDSLHKFEREGEPISKEAWKESDHFREGLEYYDGMTTSSAEFLATRKDEEEARADVISRATGWQSAAGILSSFGAGVFEPLNLGVGLVTFGAGTALSRLASVGKNVKNLARYGKYVPAATKGAAEGVAAAGIIEAATYNARQDLQSDYDVYDSLFNFGTSLILGAGLNVGGTFISEKINAREFRRREAKLDGVVQQVVSGRRVDTSVIDDVLDIDDVKFVRNVIESSFDEGAIPTEKLDELLNFSRVLGEGENNVFAAAKAVTGDIERLISENRSRLDYLSSPEAFNEALAAEGYPVMMKAALTENIDNYVVSRAAARAELNPGKKGKRLKLFDGETDLRVKELREDLKVFDKLNDEGRSVAAAEKLRNESKELRSAIKAMEKERADLVKKAAPDPEIVKQQLDNAEQVKVERVKARIRENQNVESDNFYSSRDFEKPEEFFNDADEVDVTGRVEEAEAYINELRDEDLLDADEIAYFEKLNTVNEKDIEAGFRAAEICLNRG
jgi:hypothetical protein